MAERSHYIVAQSEVDAIKQAEKWGWKPVPAPMVCWRNRADELIHYCGDCVELGHHQKGTKIYLGPGWSTMKGAKMLSRTAVARGYVIMMDGKQ